MAKNCFDVKISISTMYSMSISHGVKLSTRNLEEYCSVGPLTSGFNGTVVSLRRHRVCIVTMQFILPSSSLLVIRKDIQHAR